MLTDPTGPAPEVSAEGRRLIDDFEMAVQARLKGAGEAGQAAADLALSAYVAGLEAEAARLREALGSTAWQFAYPGTKGGRLVLSTGGLSALEEAFDALGWPDPKPCPERECEAEGCFKEATTGTPTPDGYKRLCFEHYRGVQAAAQRGRTTEGVA